VENGLFSYFESFEAERRGAAPLGLVPLQGATLREPKTPRKEVQHAIGPAWRLDTAAQSSDAFRAKYILAGDDGGTTQSWRESMQVHIDFANDSTT
jgi:hypothetical protein